MISFRLSLMEYQSLKTHYRAHGARNVSDLARLALQRIINEPLAPRDPAAPNIGELDQRVRALESDIMLIKGKLSAT